MDLEHLCGLVIKVYGLFYTVRYDNNKEVNCTLQGKIRKNKELNKYSNPVTVGDNVYFKLNDDTSGTIIDVYDRKNVFSRKDKGRARKEDIIAANLDNIIVIQAFSHPPFNLRFVDRLVVRGNKEGISVKLCVNKLDEATESQIEYIKDYYKNTDLDIFFVSAKTGEGIDIFENSVKAKRSILSGYSGVGKSTILNKIYPGLNLSTSNVSDHTGKGRHTTTNVSLVLLEDQTEFLDTPGVREFGLMDIDPCDLGLFFYEFNEYSDGCVFSPCTHDHEPKCGVKDNVESGNIHKDRYHSYLNILYSLKENYENRYSN